MATAFMQTMFVPISPFHSPNPQQHPSQVSSNGPPSPTPSFSSFPSPPQPLKPVFTLENSASCIHLPLSPTIPSIAGQVWWGAPTRIHGGAGTNSGQMARNGCDELYQHAHHDVTGRKDLSKASPLLQRAFYAALQAGPNLISKYAWGDRPETTTSRLDEAADHSAGDQIVNGVIYYSNSRTARHGAPFKSQAKRGTTQWQLKQFAEATLGSGSLRKVVKLPDGEDENEWLAVNIVDFYNQINLLYGSITEFCSPQSCPEMKATDEFEYLWQDNDTFKKPTKMSAPEYVEHLMSWIQKNIDDENMFPSRIGVPFPKTFRPLILQMFKRLYRVYAHVYCHHYHVILNLGLEPHLNTSFKHYVLFVDEHKLATGRDFWGPLGDLVDSMLKSD